MKKILILLSIVALSSFAYVDTAYLQELLVNGNAENGITGWITSDDLWDADNEITPKEGEFFFWPCKAG